MNIDVAEKKRFIFPTAILVCFLVHASFAKCKNKSQKVCSEYESSFSNDY